MEQIRYPRKLDSKRNNFHEGKVARKHLQKQAFKRGKKNCPRVSFVFYEGKV